uniref:CsgG/HfaB family protein n=1 Tax=Roseihalotalea indica TaxID=2867963 RepID=A0AA49JEC1_9BACT|nr:CsgG/HfaB family protein [Tunicatimonas sp. TK19036]
MMRTTQLTILKPQLWLGLMAVLLNGCAPYLNQPLQPGEARLGAESGIYHQLQELPEPQEKIVAAVYKFRDQTGQYKPSDVGASWSTAVTQGATSILQRALDVSGWFTTIEREGLSNLLNERKIIRSSRQAYEQQQGAETDAGLPPLLFAGILLEGGIISYDANVLTGGAGARYFGTGGSAQYRQDRVTVYLRAISTTNGRVLKTVYTSRTVLSQKVDVGVFRFVSFQRLLEAETGFTHNEPAELAVREAIEKAVQSLVIEGVLDGLWNLKHTEEIHSPAITMYQREIEANDQTDYLGRQLNRFERSSLRLGANLGTFRYAGDYPNPVLRPAGGLQLGFQVSSWLTAGLEASQGTLAGEGVYQEVRLLGAYTEWRLFPETRFTPLMQLGGGWISEEGQPLSSGYGTVTSGLGAEYLLNQRVSLQGQIRNHYVLSDELDQVQQGKYNDFFWSASVGIHLYFGKR